MAEFDKVIDGAGENMSAVDWDAVKRLREERMDQTMIDSMPEEVPARVAVLQDGAALTSGDRDVTYGPPKLNLKCQAALYDVLMSYGVTGCDRGLAHDAAMMHVCAKLARIATGPGAIHRDNYVDAATYIAIAYEVAEGEK